MESQSVSISSITSVDNITAIYAWTSSSRRLPLQSQKGPVSRSPLVIESISISQSGRSRTARRGYDGIEYQTAYESNHSAQDDGTKCSIFSFDINAKKSLLPIARNALRKLRTLRHPGVIKVFDTVEVRDRPFNSSLGLSNCQQTDAYIYIATERLVPLGWHIRRKSLTEETLKWGLFNIAVSRID